jgi:hypothetical protein
MRNDVSEGAAAWNMGAIIGNHEAEWSKSPPSDSYKNRMGYVGIEYGPIDQGWVGHPSFSIDYPSGSFQVSKDAPVQSTEGLQLHANSFTSMDGIAHASIVVWSVAGELDLIIETCSIHFVVYATGHRTQMDPTEVISIQAILLGGFSLACMNPLKRGWRDKKPQKQMNGSVARSAIFTGLLVGCLVSSSTIMLYYESEKQWASFVTANVFAFVMIIAAVNLLISYELSRSLNLKRGHIFMQYSGIALSFGFTVFILPLTILSEQLLTLIISSLNGVMMGALPILFGMEVAVTRASVRVPNHQVDYKNREAEIHQGHKMHDRTPP